MTNQQKQQEKQQEIPPFHSLPFPAYYRTECQDKYCTSRLAYHVATDNECASSLLLDPSFDKELSYESQPLIHGHQYSRKIRCFGPWVNAAGFADAALAEISNQIRQTEALSDTRRHS